MLMLGLMLGGTDDVRATLGGTTNSGAKSGNVDAAMVNLEPIVLTVQWYF